MIFALEGLRGLAALIVSLFHGWISYATGFSLIRNGWVFVDLFFVISGFVMSHVYQKHISDRRELFAFLIKRFGRLYPLHILTLFAFIVGEYLLQIIKIISMRADHPVGVHPADFNLINAPSLFANVTLLQSLGISGLSIYNGPSWSISTEVWTYFIFAFSVLILPAIWRAWSWVGLGALGLIICLWAASPQMDYMTNLGIFRCFYGFFIGALLPVFRDRFLENAKNTINDVLQLITLILIVTLVCNVDRYPVISYLLPVFFGVLVISLSSDRGVVALALSCRPLQALGRLSYSIYMVHYTVLIFFNPIGEGVVEPYKSLLRIIYIAVVLIISVFTYRYIELPWRKRFRAYAASSRVVMGRDEAGPIFSRENDS